MNVSRRSATLEKWMCAEALHIEPYALLPLQVIPAMAQHYGFDYEFVTYKWPNWLHKQV